MTGSTILVIEDASDIVELLRYNLERERYRVLVESTGEEGLRTARSQMPDLILLDLGLPGLGGLEVCRRLKSNPPADAIPIIMITARGEESDVILGLEMGADDYI
ncbi:MAG TPA: response regulator, partial [Acidobacteriota bacterium]|nr:response regulator [Acidobacteriota bacterium]